MLQFLQTSSLRHVLQDDEAGFSYAFSPFEMKEDKMWDFHSLDPETAVEIRFENDRLTYDRGDKFNVEIFLTTKPVMVWQMDNCVRVITEDLSQFMIVVFRYQGPYLVDLKTCNYISPWGVLGEWDAGIDEILIIPRYD
jgi:hypothetical protein